MVSPLEVVRNPICILTHDYFRRNSFERGPRRSRLRKRNRFARSKSRQRGHKDLRTPLESGNLSSSALENVPEGGPTYDSVEEWRDQIPERPVADDYPSKEPLDISVEVRSIDIAESCSRPPFRDSHRLLLESGAPLEYFLLLKMPERADITYFGAGPASLPTDVLETAAKALINYENTGIGLAEHSHRSQIATNILETTKKALAEYLDIPNDYEILFMQGGGSGEFSATVYNLVGVWVEREKQRILKKLNKTEQDVSEDELVELIRKSMNEELKVDYLITGSWSVKANQEATRLLGSQFVNVATDARKVNNGKFGKIPPEDTWRLSKKSAMVYYCDNETVDGVEFPHFPSVLEPKGNEDDPIVVADMSSNILSRRIPIKNFSVIFFGAQKNLGFTGITVVIIKKSLLPPAVATPAPTLMRKLGLPIGPVVLSYDTIAKNNSLYNTLSIFDVFIALQVLLNLLERWKDSKVDGQEALSTRKSALIYEVLDKHPESYKVVPDKSIASRMNICFRVTHFDGGKNGEQFQKEDLGETEKIFLSRAEKKGLQGLKGHRSVGGIRASNYNSLSLQGVEKLVAFLQEFAQGPKIMEADLMTTPYRNVNTQKVA